MSKVVNTFSTADPMEWKLTRKRVDTTTGEVSKKGGEIAKDNKAGPALKDVFDKAKLSQEGNQSVKKTDPGQAQKPLSEGKIPVDKQKDAARQEQEANYQGVRSEAKKLSHLTQGTVRHSESSKAPRDHTGAQTQAQQPQMSSQTQAQHLQQGPVTANIQNTAAMSAGSKIGKPVADGPKIDKPAESGSKTRRSQAREGPKTAKEGNVSKGKQADMQSQQVSAQAGQAGAIASGEGLKEIAQHTEGIADNIDEKGETKEDSASQTTPRGRAAAASRQLGGIIAGQGELGSGTTTTGDGTNLELTADGVEPESSLEGKKALGLEIYNADGPEAEKVKMVAIEYGHVEQILKQYVSLQDKIDNRSEKELLKRVIADTEKELAAAQLLIEQLRTTRGRVSAGGYGMSA